MEKREESVQFSLKELLDLEDQRLAEQTREREAVAAREAREESERKDRKEREEAERRRAADTAAADRRRAELDEVAKREAMQKAVVEQARLEVEVRARNEERERERRHEVELERLRSQHSRSGSIGGYAGAALAGAVVMLGFLMGMHFGVVKPAADRHLGELGDALSAEKAKSFDLAQQVEQERRTNGELRANLNRAPDAPPIAASTTKPQATAPPKLPKNPTPPPTKDLGPCTNDWDPLCGKIGR